MGVHEPHIATEDQLRLVQKTLGRFNYKIHRALTTGRGRVAVICHMRWELISHAKIDECLLYVVLSDPDGFLSWLGTYITAPVTGTLSGKNCKPTSTHLTRRTVCVGRF